MVSAIPQLGVLASHKTNFESVAQGAWELDMLPFGRCHFLSDHLLRKSAFRDFFTYNLKAHTISNKLVIKVSAQKKREKN